MGRTTRILALMTSLVFVAAGAEVLAQNAGVTQGERTQKLQREMTKYCTQAQGQVVANAQNNRQGKAVERGKRSGPGDGTGNQGTQPKDGTGYGSKSGKRTGPQDGTGPRNGNGGNARRGGGRN